MKAKIISIKFDSRFDKPRTTICQITFNDPYCNNVKRVVKGVAKCNPDDTFDETLGQRIAEGRAKRAMFQRLDESAYRAANYLEIQSDIQRRRARRETKHIQELLNNYYNEQQDNKKA